MTPQQRVIPSLFQRMRAARLAGREFFEVPPPGTMNYLTVLPNLVVDFDMPWEEQIRTTMEWNPRTALFSSGMYYPPTETGQKPLNDVGILFSANDWPPDKGRDYAHGHGLITEIDPRVLWAIARQYRYVLERIGKKHGEVEVICLNPRHQPPDGWCDNDLWVPALRMFCREPERQPQEEHYNYSAFAKKEWRSHQGLLVRGCDRFERVESDEGEGFYFPRESSAS